MGVHLARVLRSRLLEVILTMRLTSKWNRAALIVVIVILDPDQWQLNNKPARSRTEVQAADGCKTVTVFSAVCLFEPRGGFFGPSSEGACCGTGESLQH